MTVMTTMSIIIVATVITMSTITTTATMTTVMKSDNIPQKPALSVVTSIDVSIGTEIISDSESNAYSADHPDHSKFNNSFKIKKHRYRESTERNKVGIYRGRGGHPPETLTALGYHTFCIHGHCHGHRHGQSTALYLLTAPDETALAASVLQFSAMCAHPSQPRPVTTGTARSEDHRGRSGGRSDIRFYPSPNPIFFTGKKGVLRERRRPKSESVSL